MTKYLNFFESESGFTEAVEAGQLYYPNVSYTEDDDTVHWKAQSANPVETPMLRMSFSTSTPGQEVVLRNHRVSGVTAIEIDGTPVDIVSSGGTYSIESPGSHTAVYQFSSSAVPRDVFWGASGQFDAFTSAEITSAVTSIGVGAFENCGGLSGVSIPDSVTAIGDGAFEESGLRYLTIKDTVTSLGAYAFKGCAQMRSARIGSGITSIPSLEFADCTSLQSVTLPGNLMQINHGAFSGCSSLYDISIPSGVTSIGTQAFMGCSGLTAVYFNSQVPPLLGGSAFTATNDCPIYVPAGLVDTYKEAWPGYAARIRAMHRISASVNDETLGEVMLGQETAPEGAQVGFDVEAFDSEQNQVLSVTVTDGNGDEVECTNDWDNHYTFTMPDSDVTIFATIEEKQKYNITATVNDDSLGEVSIQETASEGDHVEFDVEVFDLLENQVLSVTVTDGNGDEVQCTNEFDNNYSFEMPDSDVTIFVTIGEKEKTMHTVTVNSTDDLVTGAYPINEETGDWDWDYEGELSFLEGEYAVFAIRLPEGYQAVSAQVSDEWGDNIDEAELNDRDDGDGVYYECVFTMPGFDVSVFIEVAPVE